MKRSAVERHWQTAGVQNKQEVKNEESNFSNKSRNDSDLQCRRRISAGYCIGYSAVQVGFVDKKEKVVNKDANGKKEIRNRHGVNKAQMGHFAKAGVSGKRFVREFKFENADEYKLADEIKADIFAEGDKVDVTAISKGKGFQGAIKRLGQHRGPMAHGSKFHRHQGSNGACSSPSRVFKGKGMPGHMGSVKVTTQNLEVVRVDAENNLLLIKGAVPGAKKALITVKETTKTGK